LIILDGWGYRESFEHNAVRAAGTPCLDALRKTYLFTTLGASGLDVGLPEGQMGNSEVGHLNLGAGRVVYQDFTRINLAIENVSFADYPALNQACSLAAASGGALHLLGLLSDGGVHSHQDHLHALLDLAKARGLGRVFVHAFLDGRDTPPRSGLAYMEALEAKMSDIGLGQVATVCGRFYAMDRDTRWERVEAAYRALCEGEGERAGSGSEAIQAAYGAGETDEFVRPRVIGDGHGGDAGALADGDVGVFFNFRADRARELTRALTVPGFREFDVGRRPRLAGFVTFTEYDDDFGLPVAFPQVRLPKILGEVIAAAGLRQLRIAETEKYAHVTFFFNGGEEQPFPLEERILIASPRGVATYDLQPEMSAFAVKERLVEEVEKERNALIVANFANLDMVGHTGSMEAAMRAVRAVDTCVGEVVDALCRREYRAIITADHGNAEQMWDPHSGQAHTAHSTNPVPCIVVDRDGVGARLRQGGTLADVAPTLLELMGLDPPQEMTGTSLLRLA
jgi:2,3-bisphosphoglycerate-independent phosphoglycerate mutase